MADIPSSDEYRRALRSMQLAHAITDTYYRLLRAHCAAPEHTLTTLQLAGALEWEVHNAVNAHYGGFGEKLAKRLKWRVPEGHPQASSFATFEGGSPDDPHTKWIMRHEVSAALSELRIVPCAGTTRR